MITKEQFVNKYCCFYVSDFHLEMILLPYIEKKLQSGNISILTEFDLEKTVKVLMEKVNIEGKKKEQILNIKWNKNESINLKQNTKNIIIINGDLNFINKKHKEIEKLKLKKAEIVDCYNICESNIDISEIKKIHTGILNTQCNV